MSQGRLAGFIIDCETEDLEAAAAFWSEALGLAVQPGEATQDNPYIALEDGPGGLHVEVQKVEHASRVHLDLEADNVEAEVRRLEALGARRMGPVKSWVVLEAPTGQRFCVVPSRMIAPVRKFALAYTEAWNSADPKRVADCFDDTGRLTINDGEPCVGREALRALAAGFMADLPDMVLEMDELRTVGDGYEYHWTLRGTARDGGARVDISGYEEWMLSPQGLILESRGHMDSEDYERQLAGR